MLGYIRRIDASTHAARQANSAHIRTPSTDHRWYLTLLSVSLQVLTTIVSDSPCQVLPSNGLTA